jgi:hypothetical protein
VRCDDSLLTRGENGLCSEPNVVESFCVGIRRYGFRAISDEPIIAAESSAWVGIHMVYPYSANWGGITRLAAVANPALGSVAVPSS